MLVALLRALAALPEPRLRRAMGLGLSVAVAVVAALWLSIGALLHHGTAGLWWPLAWALDVLGGLGVLVLTWLLFPAVVTLAMGLFLEQVAAAVEARDYPGRVAPRRQPLTQQLQGLLRLAGLSLLLNLLALPLYVALPGINLFIFLGLNGYLLGREYFEVVALRRLDPLSTRVLRHRFGGRVFLGGVVIAGLFLLPLVNLIAPVIATAFMLHVFEGLRRAEPAAATRIAG
jgi:CysZ protein